MTEVENYCLGLIHQGLLRLGSEGIVERYVPSRGRWEQKKALRNARPDGSYRFRYHFRLGRTQRGIMANRLLWMLANKREIPEGYIVDHVDGVRTNDTIGNLVLQEAKGSHTQGNSKQLDLILAYLCRWFWFVGTYLREPISARELNLVEQGF